MESPHLVFFDMACMHRHDACAGELEDDDYLLEKDDSDPEYGDGTEASRPLIYDGFLDAPEDEDDPTDGIFGDEYPESRYDDGGASDGDDDHGDDDHGNDDHGDSDGYGDGIAYDEDAG